MRGGGDVARRAFGWSLSTILLVGCVRNPGLVDERGAGVPPRPRVGRYATVTLGGGYFTSREELGRHGYRHGQRENNSIVYTCAAGHIDIAHVRKAADWTAYLTAVFQKKVKNSDSEFSFKLQEPSRYFISLDYPEHWNDMPAEEKERAARECSILLGQYVAWTASTWHEILTWFGYRSTGLVPEFSSAFAWEDTFSNLLGTHVAVAALRDAVHPYDQAVTSALDRQLRKLDAQPARTARRAAQEVKGRWYANRLLLFPRMKKRNLDIGVDDGFVTPWIVPSLDECAETEPQPYPVPTLEGLAPYGFSARLEIEPREMEKDDILRVVYPDPEQGMERIEPAIHFTAIMDHIREDARRKYGPDVDLPD